jgi:hypothetical protein
MTYRPTETSFGPPLLIRVPSLIYAALAASAVIVVLIAESSPSTSWLYVNMRGVRIRGDGVEYRDVVSLGIPRLKRFKWAQIDRVILDAPRNVALDLWDGTRAFLPEVSDRLSLSATLEKVAHARAIPVRGGHGLDELPESGEFQDEDEA